MRKKIWSGLSSLFVFFLCFAIIATSTASYYAGTINGFLGISTSMVVEAEDGEEAVTINYESSYGELTGENLQRLIADTYVQAIEEGNEGMVLLKNSNSALPLTADEMNVTLFGHAVVQPLYRNNSAGSSAYNGDEGVDLYEALESAGFHINNTLYTAYQKSKTARAGGNSAITTGTDASWSFGEEDSSFYTDDLKASWENDFNDVAIVMLAREGGEGIELYQSDPEEGISQLALHQKEKDLFNMIYESGKFDKVVVLLNSGNPMEVDWLDEYHVDACLWIGCPGQKGFVSTANLLTGAANPSGKLTTTYAVNSLSSPALVNSSFNNQTWINLDYVVSNSTDAEGEASYYAVQAEGIYVGYKYYETRYEDSILGRFGANSAPGSSTDDNWNYTKEVSYPFGYGLSYTTFEQTLDNVKIVDDSVMVTITVKNVGATAGKSVVQVYAQTPYGEYEQKNLVEKSAIQLLDFAKTGMIEPGKSETVTIECDKYLLASYDYTNAKGYIMSEGDYYIAIGDDAHDALNNVLAAKGAQGMVDVNGNPDTGASAKTYHWTEKFDNSKYRYSAATGTVVTNRFDDGDINYWVEDAVTYLTRSDWAGTYPVEPTRVECSPEMLTLLNGYLYEMPEDAPLASELVQGKNQNIPLAAMYGLDYDDDMWDTYLSQLTVAAMASLLPDMCGNAALPVAGKPATKIGDGPDGIGGTSAAYDAKKYGFNAETTCYTSETVLAATFSKELMAKRSDLMADESIFLGLMEIWAPGGNLHRTPFGGRNFEYYSEDANMNYLCSIPSVKALEAKGIKSGIKHCALNDQENNRIGIACFFTEQSLREGGLRGFEGAIAVADASSVMQGFNRLGLIGCSAHEPMNNQIIRGEWGLEGIIVTDACTSVTSGYRGNYVDQLVAGSDSFCIDFSGQSATDVKNLIKETDDGNLVQALRRAAKNVLYCTVNSPAMNGYSSSTQVVTITPWWVPVLNATIIAFAVLTAFSLIMLTITIVKEKKQKAK